MPRIEIICKFCGWKTEWMDIGKYIRHLIKQHWAILQKLHDNPDEWEE